jgi:glycerate 2-kinase
MKIFIAPDKFRGSLSAEEVVVAIQKGIEGIDKNSQIESQIMADGGEQTAEILTKSTGGFLRKVQVLDPLFRKINVSYGISGDSKTAFIEMAKASGLSLLDLTERNPMQTTTFGTGQLILDAIEQQIDKIILCIGGSATNDGGIGMAAALGYRFLDENEAEIQPIGKNLAKIKRIDSANVHPKLKQIQFEIACDVSNPFFGTQGAAKVYAKQKGANQAEIELLDAGLKHLATLIQDKFGINLQNMAGSGAAGGLGGGCIAFLNASLQSGVELVMSTLNIEKQIQEADLIITGEGKIDTQTLSGKVVKGLAEKAKKHQKPIIAFCGTLDLKQVEIQSMGLLSAFSILNAPMNLGKAKTNAAELLSETVAQVMATFLYNK